MMRMLGSRIAGFSAGKVGGTMPSVFRWAIAVTNTRLRTARHRREFTLGVVTLWTDSFRIPRNHACDWDARKRLTRVEG